MNPTEAAEQVMSLMCRYLEDAFGERYDFEVFVEQGNPYLIVVRVDDVFSDGDEEYAGREYHLSVSQIMADMVRPRTIHEQIDEAWSGDNSGLHALTPTGELILSNLVRDQGEFSSPDDAI